VEIGSKHFSTLVMFESHKVNENQWGYQGGLALVMN